MWKGRQEIENGKWKKYENKQRTFFSFFSFHFLKPLKFAWSVPKWKISTGKKHILRREKIGKSDFAPSEKYSFYASD